MTAARRLARLAPAPGRIGLIDIGSNSVRLVLYDQVGTVPLATFNEKLQCALGQGMASSGRLNPTGKERAERAISRFVALARATGVKELTALATAAIRMAEDGPAFAEDLRKHLGLNIHVIEGTEEAQLGGWGVLGSIDQVAGVSCDLGGGSTELAALEKHQVGKTISLPVGVLSISEHAEGDVLAAQKLIKQQLSKAKPVLAEMEGKTLYAIGGSFRALAKIEMEEARYPIRLLHEYSLEARYFSAFCDRIARMPVESLLAMSGITRKRAGTLMAAACTMQALIASGKPEKIMFSMQGIREGWLYRQYMPEDPLMEVTREVTLYHGGNVSLGEKLANWTAPITMAETSPEWDRIRRAACLLVTIPRYELSAERSEAAFYDVLQSPILAISHPSRFLLALAVMRRYQHSAPIPLPGWQSLDISPTDILQARLVGLTLNLAFTLCGGVSKVLDQISLTCQEGRIALEARDHALIEGEIVTKRLARIQAAMDSLRQPELLG